MFDKSGITFDSESVSDEDLSSLKDTLTFTSSFPPHRTPHIDASPLDELFGAKSPADNTYLCLVSSPLTYDP